MSVVALVLAAGSSVRFGSDKRRSLLADGRSLLVHSVESACAVFDDVRVVLREGERGVDLGLPARCRVISSPDFTLGMGHSLAAGAASLADSEAQAVAILLGDMPWGGVRDPGFACTGVQWVNDSPALSCWTTGPSGVVRARFLAGACPAEG